MFKVLQVNGPNILTDKGGIELAPFSCADGGRTQPVSTEDFKRMRAAFVALPELIEALQRLVVCVEHEPMGFEREAALVFAHAVLAQLEIRR